MIAEAVAELQKEVDWPSNDAIVSELKYAFWVGLFGPGYDDNIWRKTLSAGFAVGRRRGREPIHQRFNAIRRFRNRIAHHEPIFHRDLPELHGEMLEAIGWMCTDTSAWTAHVSRLLIVHEQALISN
jgi:hypothetical protein